MARGNSPLRIALALCGLWLVSLAGCRQEETAPAWQFGLPQGPAQWDTSGTRAVAHQWYGPEDRQQPAYLISGQQSGLLRLRSPALTQARGRTIALSLELRTEQARGELLTATLQLFSDYQRVQWDSVLFRQEAPPDQSSAPDSSWHAIERRMAIPADVDRVELVVTSAPTSGKVWLGGLSLALEPTVRQELLMETDRLARMLDNRRLVLLHVSADRAGYEQGHLPGARFLAFDSLVVERGGVPNELPPLERLRKLFGRLGLDGDRRIVIYDDQDGLLAARAFFTLDYLGLGEKSALLDGQLQKWRAEGRPLSSDEPAFEPTNFIPRVRSELLIGQEDIRKLLEEKRRRPSYPLALIDSRSPAEYRGEEPGQGLERPGHIPGAINIPWKQNLRQDQPPVLLPAEELLELYADRGLETEGLVVAYCRSGRSAAYTYFVLRYLGLAEVGLYDGSFSEWNRNADNPVENAAGN